MPDIPTHEIIDGASVPLSAERAAEIAAAWQAAQNAPAPVPRWSSLQFIERFTDAEQLAIVTAAASTPALRLWYDKAMAADEIVADDPRTVAGVQALVDAGLLTAERAAEILGSA